MSEIVSVASGKGGTGKTTVAVNLAVLLARERAVTYADCDVEEPNGHLFLKPAIADQSEAGIAVPRIDDAACTGCGTCAGVCRYNALACIRGRVLVFSELCHGCGGCAIACPAGAISEVQHPIGVVETGFAGGIRFVQGRLNVGAPMSPPLIRAAKHAAIEKTESSGVVIMDAPPGTSCAMIAAVEGSDFLVLVAEPTVFGLHDLSLTVAVARKLNVPLGVVINRCGIGDDSVTTYCNSAKIEILGNIPDDRRVAESYSRGEIAIEAVPSLVETFAGLAARVQAAAERQLSRSEAAR